MPIKYTFTPRELINTYNRQVMTKVAEIFESVLRNGYGGRDESVILEDCGSWLEQLSWTDRMGFYMTIRLHPLDKHREDVQEKGRAITAKFLELFPDRTANGTFYEGHEGYKDGEKVTVYVHTSTTSIGD